MTASPIPDPQDLFEFAAWLVTEQGRAFVDSLPDTASEPRLEAVGERGDVAGVAPGEPQNAHPAAVRKVGAVTVLADWRRKGQL